MQLDLFDAKANDIFTLADYGEFASSLAGSECRKCPLHKSRTHIVVDRGNPSAKIMVIGEAPGENEDLQQKAFVGRAGKLFDKIMESIGLDTNRDMLICNVVKCRPPENRAPSKEEAQACLPFLKKQIELVSPRIIVLLGATALKHISPAKDKFSMEKEAGGIFVISEFPGVLFMVFYHPAALLYNPKLKTPMWEHAKKLKKIIENGFREC